jgi:SAM-dependent methyltransferase
MIHHREFGDLAQTAAELVVDQLRAVGYDTGTVVDLGCGSGILARAMLAAGYDVWGVDLSEDMVDIARREAPAAELAVGSIHDAEIPSAVAVTAIGEVLNYATDARAGLDALATLASRVHGALAPHGLFVFDVATPGRNGPSSRRIVFHDREDWSLAMQADELDDTLDRRIVVFRRTKDGLYRRVDEHHVCRLYEPAAVEGALHDAGFVIEQLAGYAPSATRSTPASGWSVFVARAVPAGR